MGRPSALDLPGSVLKGYPWHRYIIGTAERKTSLSFQNAMLQMLDNLGWSFWDAGDYDLFTFGIRNDIDEEQQSANTFNDLIGVAYSVDGEQRIEIFPATTDPGISWRKDPRRNGGGVGIVREGQWRHVYKLGYHGDEEALVERPEHPFLVYRDSDFDERLTLDAYTTEKGWGFNMHDAGLASKVVNRWSGGCQVLAIEKTMYHIVDLVKAQRDAGFGDVVSYSLFRASWLWRDALEVRREFSDIQDL